MVVGDDFQSIYSFNGANYDNILEFPKRYPDAKIIKLKTNYRSTPEILNIANKSIANNEKQFQKILHAIRLTGSDPVRFAADTVFQQTSFVVSQIRSLSQDGICLLTKLQFYIELITFQELQMEMSSTAYLLPSVQEFVFSNRLISKILLPIYESSWEPT